MVARAPCSALGKLKVYLPDRPSPAVAVTLQVRQASSGSQLSPCMSSMPLRTPLLLSAQHFMLVMRVAA